MTGAALVVAAALTAGTLPGAVHASDATASTPLAGVQLAQAPQAQQPQVPAAVRAQQAHEMPGLSFDEPNRRFPTIEEGERVSVEFDFVNSSDRTIRITNIRASCGCTVPTLEKRTYAPGERGTIEAVFNSTGRPGQQTSTIAVETDNPGQEQIRLSMVGMVTSPLRLSQSNIPLQIVAAGTEKTMELYLLDTTGTDVSITDIVSTDEKLIVEAGEPEPYVDEDNNREGRRTPIRVTVPSDYPISAIRANVQVRTDNDRRRSLPFMVHGRVAGEVALNPPQVYFGMVNPGAVEERAVTVQTADGSVFELKGHRIETEGLPGGSLNSAPPEIELTLSDPQTARRGAQVLTVRVTAGEEAGRSGGRIVLTGVIGPDDNRREVEVPLMVTGFVRNSQAASAGN